MATDLLDATVKEDTPNDEGDHFGKNRNRSRLDTVETRRYAAYFASTTSLGKMWAAADKENRWDLVSATVEPGEDQRAYPARDIDIASHSKMQFTAHKPNPSPNAPDATSSQGISTLDTVPAAPFNRELKPRFSRSRRDGLNEAVCSHFPHRHFIVGGMTLICTQRKEALAILTECEKGTIVCPRPDCHDTVPDLKALIYHLHIHNIHDRQVLLPALN